MGKILLHKIIIPSKEIISIVIVSFGRRLVALGSLLVVDVESGTLLLLLRG